MCVVYSGSNSDPDLNFQQKNAGSEYGSGFDLKLRPVGYLRVTFLKSAVLKYSTFLKEENRLPRHESGAKIRLRECDYKLIDEDGNVILVLEEVTDSHHYSCSIINEIAENSTGTYCLTLLVASILATGHMLKYGVRSPKFILAPCAQLYSFAETPQLPPPFPVFGLIYRTRALLVRQDRRQLFFCKPLLAVVDRYHT
jgi:hypothetical protein